MKFRRYFFINVGLLLSAIWLTVGCSTIDDDLSDCYVENQYRMDYQLRLVTNMTTELKTQLTTMTELSVANALTTHLKDIFTDFAHDVDLSFYDTEGDLNRLQHDKHIMDANQSSYTLTLPMRKYMHLAIANIADNDMVDLSGDEYSPSSILQQAKGQLTDGKEILRSHTTGLFTARHSTYVFPETSPLIIAERIATDNNLLCFCSVNFPSRDAVTALAKSRAEEKPALWQFKVYLTKPDGSITETILNIDEPLKAGDLKIIKGELDDEGAVRPYDSTVGVSVTLDWNSGGIYTPNL